MARLSIDIRAVNCLIMPKFDRNRNLSKIGVIRAGSKSLKAHRYDPYVADSPIDPISSNIKSSYDLPQITWCFSWWYGVFHRRSIVPSCCSYPYHLRLDTSLFSTHLIYFDNLESFLILIAPIWILCWAYCKYATSERQLFFRCCKWNLEFIDWTKFKQWPKKSDTAACERISQELMCLLMLFL